MKHEVAFVPIAKIDVEAREVHGVLAEEALDKSGEILDYAKSKQHFEKWSQSFADATASTGQEASAGNLRAMHGTVAAGKFTSVSFNDAEKRVEVVAKVVDDEEWKKCQQGVYTGFSIGGGYGERWADPVSKGVRYVGIPTEGSLVDNPCMYGAQFSVVKSGGASTLVKFVGHPVPELNDDQVVKLKKAWLDYHRAEVDVLDKGAAEAVEHANTALTALKAMAAELMLMPGEPDVWTHEDILTAVRKVISAKVGAEIAAADEPEVPGAGPDEPSEDLAAAAKGGDLKKLFGSVTDALTKVQQSLDAQQNQLKALPTTDTVTKAVDSAKSDLQKSIDEVRADFDTRLKVVEDQPANPGRTVNKTLGSGDGEDSDPVSAMDKAIRIAEASGAHPDVVRKMREGAVEDMLKASRAT